MKNANRLVAAAAIGAVGVSVLAACSSGTNSGEASPSTSSVATSDSDREAAKAEDMKDLKAKAGGPFSAVAVTHNGDARCTRKDTNTEVVIRCQNVKANFMGDAVYVRVPGADFTIKAVNDTPNKSGMKTYLRTWANVKEDSSDSNDITWNAPQRRDIDWGWGVGVESKQSPIDVTVTVRKS